MGKLLESFNRHAPGLRKYIRGFFPDTADVEDILQEVFLRAFKEEQRTTIFFYKAFLFRLARNVCLNERAQARRNLESTAEDFGGSDVFIDRSQVDGDTRLESKRKLVLLAEAVDTLPSKCRQVFIMRKIDGMRVKEIAQELGITPSAVEKHVAHGLFLCNEHLRKKGYPVESPETRQGTTAIRLGNKKSK